MKNDGIAPGGLPLVRPEPIIRADTIAWVVFDKPDLEQTQRFLSDFGLVRSHDTNEGRLFRGTGTLPYVYIARRAGRAAFVGTGFLARDQDDLERLARETGNPVVALDRPGGGRCVRLRDPHGFLVEVAHGIEPASPLPTRTEPLSLNTPFAKVRINETQRPPLQPAAVVRLGHCVIQSTTFDDTAAWYMRHLGLIPTDVQCLSNGKPVLAFMRTDRGEQPSDHHAFVVAMGFRNDFLHCAFEVLDLDALGQGQQVLKNGGWKHAWGIGRHLLGSQLFDYWHDGDGHEHEHYADGDVFDNTHPTQYSAFERGALWQWGADLPSDFTPKLGPALLRDMARELFAGRLDFGTLRAFAAAGSKRPRSWLR